MGKLLRRHSVSGKLLRVPTGYDPAYPNAGKLWRGVEICCPGWAVGDYCEFCPVVCDTQGSVYTPKYHTAKNIADLVNCDDWIPHGLDPAGDLNGAAAILLTQDEPNIWRGTSGIWTVRLRRYSLIYMALAIWTDENPLFAAWVAGTDVACRVAIPGWANAYGPADCTTEEDGAEIDQVVSHYGTLDLDVGDTT